jgi:esterase/lipase superfamily enzyme
VEARTDVSASRPDDTGYAVAAMVSYESMLAEVRRELDSIPAPAMAAVKPADVSVMVPVYYATDRAPTGAGRPTEFFGTRRGALQLGRVLVTVPKRHNAGIVSLNLHSYRIDLSVDNTRDVLLRSLQPMSPAEWVVEVRGALVNADRREALVYVHGFREQFAGAVRRAAQLSYDLNFPGVPFVYSWPTTGSFSVSGYAADEEMVSLAAPDLRTFLTQIILNTGVNRIHIIAHSMGGRVVAEALRDLPVTQKTALGNIILAAPDIRAEIFMEQSAPTLFRRASRLTLYASSKDRALQLSQKLHRARRAGQGEPIIVLDSMDTIDASEVDTDLIGHGYFAENKTVMDDLFMLTQFDASAKYRNLRTEPQGSGWYYVLK